VNLLRGEGPLIRVGHRGAAALAPENTLAAFERAAEAGVDVVEFDVVDREDGAFVLAHSRALAGPSAATLDEALGWFAARPELGLHVDLKRRGREADVARAIAAAGLSERAVVSTGHVSGLIEVARAVPELALGFTYPEDRYELSRKRALVPFVLGALVAMRSSLPLRVGRLAGRAGASALMLNHLVVTRSAVAQAHARGVAVFAWTVDDPRALARMERAGVDAVVTNDPRILHTPSLH
jgi:glycerophosphoryl diester phosphodiesterase